MNVDSDDLRIKAQCFEIHELINQINLINYRINQQNNEYFHLQQALKDSEKALMLFSKEELQMKQELNEENKKSIRFKDEIKEYETAEQLLQEFLKFSDSDSKEDNISNSFFEVPISGDVLSDSE